MSAARTITITVADYQQIERRLVNELAEARRLVVCLERRVGELEVELLNAREANGEMAS